MRSLGIERVIITELCRIMAGIDDIKAAVSRAEAGQASAIALLSSTAAAIRNAIGDDAALTALAADLDAGTGALATEVTNDSPAPATPPAS